METIAPNSCINMNSAYSGSHTVPRSFFLLAWLSGKTNFSELHGNGQFFRVSKSAPWILKRFATASMNESMVQSTN